jgi:hypothetical protein
MGQVWKWKVLINIFIIMYSYCSCAFFAFAEEFMAINDFTLFELARSSHVNKMVRLVQMLNNMYIRVPVA